MGRLIRKQIYIELEQEKLLKRQAKARRVTQSALMRQAIAQVSRIPTIAPSDQGAWQDELAFIKNRARIKALGRQRGWAREELYEDRLQRFSR